MEIKNNIVHYMNLLILLLIIIIMDYWIN